MPATRRNLLTASVALPGTLAGCAAPQPATASGPVTLPLPPLPRPAVVAKPPGTAWFAPAPPAYPIYPDLRPVEAQAAALSRGLEAHVRDWLAGRAPAELPEALIPPGIDRRDYPRFRLVRPEALRPEDLWAVRPAEMPMETATGYRGFFPDPNCTYLVVPAFLAPFGARLVIEGEFPRARFFDIQVTPSFEARTYRYDAAGVGEVPIVDADIDPLPGHANPFRPGARRDAARRGYRVTFDLAMGDPVAANPAFRPPHFRGRGNARVGGALAFRGPWGVGGTGAGDGRGPFQAGEIWLRYYRPDDGQGPLAGVPLPRAWCELPGGERFWVAADAAPFIARVNRRVTPRATSAAPDPARQEGPSIGWYKQAGIFRSVVSGLAIGTGWAGPAYVRLLDRGVAGRGADLAPPNDYEQSATSATYIDYLVRGMGCEAGHVVTLTGRLPSFPDTGRGGGVMTPAEMRYWSLVGYAVPEGLDFLTVFSREAVIGVATQAVRDDELVLDPSRFYVIALSRPQDRPANARPEAGVTWAEWGPAGKVSWTMRWLSVGPEWKGPMVPTPARIGRRGEWGEPEFDARAISTNGWDGAIGAYLPRVGYMRRAAFEALGARVRAQDVPDWR